MISRVLHPLREAAWHPTDEQLVAYLDAELSARETARVRRHVGRCWACRSRQRQLEETVDAFMEAFASAADDDELPIEAARLPRAALEALHRPPIGPLSRGQHAIQRIGARMHDGVLGLRAMAVVAWQAAMPIVTAPARVLPSAPVAVRLAAAGATTMLIVLLSTGVPLSARQVARQVDRAERSVLGPIQAPVVYQRLEVTRRQRPAQGVSAAREASDSWQGDLWTAVDQQANAFKARPHDDGHGRAREEALGGPLADDPLDALLAIFARHHVDDAWPVSLRAHERVRIGESIARETVRAVRSGAGERLLTLEASSRELDAALVVRERDWHPIEQRLTVRGEATTTEFIVREVGFEVVPRASLPVAFFDPPVPAPLPAAPPIAPDALVDARWPAPPPASELVTAEVQAMYALHRVGLTAEDEIAVLRRDQVVEVSGLTTTTDRRQQIVASLANIRYVRTRIQTADEALVELSKGLVGVGAATKASPAMTGAWPDSAEAPAASPAPARAAVVPGAADPNPHVAPSPAASASDVPVAGRSLSRGPASSGLMSGAAASGPASSGSPSSTPTASSPGAQVSEATTANTPASGAPVAGATPAGAAATGASAPSAQPIALRVDETRIEADRLPVQALTDALQQANGAANPSTTATRPGDRRVDEASMLRAREAVRQSLALLERAWALRRLAEWSRRTNASTVTASTRELIELMAREHVEAASKALSALDTTVTPALPSAAAIAAAPAPAAASTGAAADTDTGRGTSAAATDTTRAADGSTPPAASSAPSSGAANATFDQNRPWVEVATDFFGIAAEIDRDTRRLFTASLAPTTEAAEEARRLRRGLDRAAQWLEALQQTRP